MTALRQRMIEDLRIRNYSPGTIGIYVRCVQKFACYFGKSPALLGPPHVRQYQVHLVEEAKASWTWFNQSVCAVRFLYQTTLGREWAITHIPFPKRPRKLPVPSSICIRESLDHLAELLHESCTGCEPQWVGKH